MIILNKVNFAFAIVHGVVLLVSIIICIESKLSMDLLPKNGAWTNLVAILSGMVGFATLFTHGLASCKNIVGFILLLWFLLLLMVLERVDDILQDWAWILLYEDGYYLSKRLF